MKFRGLAVVAILLCVQTALFAQRDRISSSIDRSRIAVLSGNIHAKAQAQYDQGPADPFLAIENVTLRLKSSPEQQGLLDRLLAEQQDPSSANFHKWVTPEQYADRFGVSSGDMAKIISWLQAEGLKVNEVARSRHWISFSSTVGQAASAFRTEIHRYKVQGETYFANAVEPSIPTAFVDVVDGIDGLNDFPLQSMAGTKGLAPDPAFNVGGQHYLAPDDLAVIYNIQALYNRGVNGSGQKIVIVGQGNINVADIQAFRTRFHLPPIDLQTILVGPDPGLGGIEPYLDVEWAGAVAPNASIIYVYARNANTAAQFAVNHNLAPVISESYGVCEPEYSPSLRSIAQQANAQGITWLAASGDSGAAGCELQGLHPQATRGMAVSFPASLPEVTAVGGSQFNEGSGNFWGSSNGTNSGSALSYIPETAWNENDNSGLYAGGGGASIFFRKPSWQHGPGVPNDNARDVPDVSLSSASHDGYWVTAGGVNYIVFGTSAATPSFAGMVAMLNQFVVSNGFQAQPGVGNINPALYRLAQSANNVFHDITTGDNNVACAQSSPDCVTDSFGYAAGPGYDLATGLGSVDANNLITQWNTRTATTSSKLAADSSTVILGAALHLTAAVTGLSGAAPTGAVSFNVGDTLLGVAQLTPSGSSMLATLSISTSQLQYGANTVTAIYDGDRIFNGSSASITIDAGLPIGESAVIPSINPAPVFESPLTANLWRYTVKLTEAAGVATVITDYIVNGVSHIDELTTAFGGATLPARGSLSANLTLANLNEPATVVFAFTGVDGSGRQWSQQISVPFYKAMLGAVFSFEAHPSVVLQDPTADPSCQWSQQLSVQERNGFPLQLTRLVAGSNDITNQIQQIFGTTRLAPFGGLTGRICWTRVAASQSSTLSIDATSENGGVVRLVALPVFRGPASSAIALAASPARATLSVPDASQTATASVGLVFSDSDAQDWSISVFPANRATSWLTVSPLSGAGPAQLSIRASAVGLAKGVYHATLIVNSGNATPAYINVPIVFEVGSSPATKVTSVTNGASLQSAFAPGMMLNVSGSGLAPSFALAKSAPLGPVMSGVSATVNGVSAPLYSISPSLLSVQVPYEIGMGTAVLGVNNNGRVSSYSFEVAASAPGIFTADDGSLLPSASGGRGKPMTLHITGDGELLPALATGAAPFSGTPIARLPKPRLPVSVTVGDVPASIQFSGIPAGSVGVTQIDFTIPPNAPLGSQPVVVISGGVPSPPANLNVTP